MYSSYNKSQYQFPHKILAEVFFLEIIYVSNYSVNIWGRQNVIIETWIIGTNRFIFYGYDKLYVVCQLMIPERPRLCEEAI